jgi:hypothetical protein
MPPRKQSTLPSGEYHAKPPRRKEYWKEKTVHWDVPAKRRQYLDVLLRVIPDISVNLQQRLDAIPPRHKKAVIAAVQSWRDAYHLDDWIVYQLIRVRGSGGTASLTALKALKLPTTELDLGMGFDVPTFSFRIDDIDLGIERLSAIRRRVRAQFKKEWEEFEKSIHQQASSKGWAPQKSNRVREAKEPERHLEWLARFQSQEATQSSIAEQSKVTKEAVYKAIRQTAYDLGIKLRTSDRQRWSD